MLGGVVREHSVKTPNAYIKRILLLFSYGNIICRHLQICFFLDYIT